jgi:RNA polymerase sigma-70 factor (ECF subfamily)
MPTTEQALQQLEERLTVLHAQQGDAEAFRRLVELYDRRLLYFVRRLLGEREEAFDVLQSVWLLVHRKLWALSSPNAFRVWLYRIAHDQAVSELRRRTRQPRHLEEVAHDELPEDEGVNDAAFANAELVHAGLRDLSSSFAGSRVLGRRARARQNQTETGDDRRCRNLSPQLLLKRVYRHTGATPGPSRLRFARERVCAAIWFQATARFPTSARATWMTKYRVCKVAVGWPLWGGL